MQKSSKHWGGERRLQLERQRKLQKLQQERLRGPVGAPDSQREGTSAMAAGLFLL